MAQPARSSFTADVWGPLMCQHHLNVAAVKDYYIYCRVD